MSVDRAAVIRSLLNVDGFGLEIGPSHSPAFPKSRGHKVEILDYASADELRAKYAGHPVNVDAIEEVDHVSDGRPIHEVIGKDGYYDFVFSSHVIEHVTDFVGYFRSCERLLKPDGVAVLAIPDKRFTFDVFQSLTTTGDVLEAYHRGDRRHSPGKVFDFIANYATLDGRHDWDARQSGAINLINDLPDAARMLDVSLAVDHQYLDVHAWRFTPSSFRLIMHDLDRLGITTLKEASLCQYDMMEFYACYSRAGAGCGKTRIELMREIQREQALSGLQVLQPYNGLSTAFALATG